MHVFGAFQISEFRKYQLNRNHHLVWQMASIRRVTRSRKFP
uniref:Uncharacterized protein n=1 Tax=Rhizophora mucronata TaxID=61149 RepID=A0A2P2QYL4_RHIMU